MRRPKLDPETEFRFTKACAKTYHAIGPDVWGERVPSNAEFCDVILDQVGNQGVLTPDELARWRELPASQRRKIARRVGP